MEMFLMALCTSIFALAVTALAFGATSRPEKQAAPEQPHAEAASKAAPTKFFARNLRMAVESPPRVPLEVLLMQIESQVHLERAAAESFLESPTSVLLHSKTASPFLN